MKLTSGHAIPSPGSAHAAAERIREAIAARAPRPALERCATSVARRMGLAAEFAALLRDGRP